MKLTTRMLFNDWILKMILEETSLTESYIFEFYLILKSELLKFKITWDIKILYI